MPNLYFGIRTEGVLRIPYRFDVTKVTYEICMMMQIGERCD